MNADRRKQIAAAITKLADLHAEIEQISQDEQDYLDNMPENMQGGERSTGAEEAVSSLDEAASAVDDAKTALEGIP